MEFWAETEEELIDDIQSVAPCRPPLPAEEEPGHDVECHTVVWWVVVFVSLFQTIHSISDKAISWLLKFIHALLKYCGQFSVKLECIARYMPGSLHRRDRYLEEQLYSTKFQHYIVCPLCHSLYTYDECVVKTGINVAPKVCSLTRFSKKCSGVMLQEVITISGKKSLYPHRIYILLL